MQVGEIVGHPKSGAGSGLNLEARVTEVGSVRLRACSLCCAAHQTCSMCLHTAELCLV